MTKKKKMKKIKQTNKQKKSSLFSLIKSPQPDSSSPFHVSRVTFYSRSTYLALTSAVILSLNRLVEANAYLQPIYFSGRPWLLPAIFDISLSKFFLYQFLLFVSFFFSFLFFSFFFSFLFFFLFFSFLFLLN